jgi:hypothetical protein
MGPNEQLKCGCAPDCVTDRLASQTSWAPLCKGGAGGRTRQLVNVDFHRIEFRPTPAALCLPLTCLLAGLCVVWAGLQSRPAYAIGPIILGVLTSCAGGIYLYFTSTKAVFDKRAGVFSKTHRTINSTGNLERAPQRVALDQIHALQLLSKKVHIKSNSTFQGYELNLVFHNAERMSVVDHGNLQWMRRDATTLSAFLETPIWDGIV